VNEKMTLNKTQRLRDILHLDDRNNFPKVVLVTIIGTLSYIILDNVKLPSYRMLSYITVQINPAIICISIAAAFFGPIAGLFVGLFGTLISDILTSNHLIAFGLVNLSYGLLGFIIGIPHYDGVQGLRNGRILGKLILFSVLGLIVMALTYLFSLIVVSGQNLLPTLLYNALPFFSVSLITLIIIAPTIIRIIDALYNFFRIK
jgi:uncharacterized membrane protein